MYLFFKRMYNNKSRGILLYTLKILQNKNILWHHTSLQNFSEEHCCHSLVVLDFLKKNCFFLLVFFYSLCPVSLLFTLKVSFFNVFTSAWLPSASPAKCWHLCLVRTCENIRLSFPFLPDQYVCFGRPVCATRGFDSAWYSQISVYTLAVALKEEDRRPKTDVILSFTDRREMCPLCM